MLRNTQLQGDNAPFRASRNPEPWHCVQRCIASASVSDRVHSIIGHYPPEPDRWPVLPVFLLRVHDGSIDWGSGRTGILRSHSEQVNLFPIITRQFLNKHPKHVSQYRPNGSEPLARDPLESAANVLLHPVKLRVIRARRRIRYLG